MTAMPVEQPPEWVAKVIASPLTTLAPWVEGVGRPPAGDLLDTFHSLIDWIDWLDDRVADKAVDTALASWVEQRWGTWRPDDPEDAPRIGRAWMVVCDLATQWPAAEQLRESLRERVSDRNQYLGSLWLGPHLDPLGSYLAAIATRQTDRSLAPLWWSVLSLPDWVPVRYVVHGLVGVQQLYRAAGPSRGRFEPQVAAALIAAGRSLVRAAGEGRISLDGAARLFHRAARRMRAAYPKIAWWRPYLSPADHPEPMGGWLADAFPELAAKPAGKTDEARRRAPVDMRSHGADPDLARWRDLAQGLREALARDPARAMRAAEKLLDEQRAYAEVTGDAHSFVQTLCNLATPIRDAEPDTAIAWAEEARSWEPFNHYPWTTLLRAKWRLDGPEASLPIAFEALERIPYVRETWHELGENLTTVGCYDQAEETFSAELVRFGDVRAAASLGYLLLDQRLYARAEQVFRTALAQSERNSYALRGLAIVLRATQRPNEAVRLLHDKLDSITSADAPYQWHQYVSALRDAGDVDGERNALAAARARGVKAHYESITASETERRLYVSSAETAVLRGQARLLRRAAHGSDNARATDLREAAKALLTRVAAAHSYDERATAESARVLADSTKFEEARSLVSDALVQGPASALLWQALAQVGLDEVRAAGAAFTHELLADLESPYRKLVELNTATRPAAELGRARVALSLQDGRAADEEAAQALQKIASWPSHATNDHYRGWWQSRVVAALADGEAGLTRPSQEVLAEIRRRATRQAELLGELEEEFVLQATA